MSVSTNLIVGRAATDRLDAPWVVSSRNTRRTAERICPWVMPADSMLQRHGPLPNKRVTVLLALERCEELEHYERALRSRGYDVAIAAGGVEGVQKLRTCDPDVLVLDTELLWGGAAGVLAVVRDDEALRRVPVVLLSGGTGFDPVEWIAPPVVSHLVRPVSRTELASHVMRSLVRSQQWCSGFTSFDDRGPEPPASDALSRIAEQIQWSLTSDFAWDDVRFLMQRLVDSLNGNCASEAGGESVSDALELFPEQQRLAERIAAERQHLRNALSDEAGRPRPQVARRDLAQWILHWVAQMHRLRQRENSMLMEALCTDIGVGD